MTLWAYRHRRSILFALSLFAISGLFTIYSTPVSLFPQVVFPRVVINMDAGDRPAERMMVEATWPVEEAVRTVPGVVSVRSNTSRGSADISINFVWGLDMVSAMMQVESAINQIRSSLPATLAFTVRRMEPTVFPVLGYSLTSAKQSQVILTGYCTISNSSGFVGNFGCCQHRSAGRRSRGISGYRQSCAAQFAGFKPG